MGSKYRDCRFLHLLHQGVVTNHNRCGRSSFPCRRYSGFQNSATFPYFFTVGFSSGAGFFRFIVLGSRYILFFRIFFPSEFIHEPICPCFFRLFPPDNRM